MSTKNVNKKNKDKKIIGVVAVIIALLLVVLVALGVFIFGSEKTEDEKSTVEVESKSTEETSETENKSYETLMNLIGDNKNVKVVYFGANWCPHCQDSQVALSEIEAMDNVTFEKHVQLSSDPDNYFNLTTEEKIASLDSVAEADLEQAYVTYGEELKKLYKDEGMEKIYEERGRPGFPTTLVFVDDKYVGGTVATIVKK